VYIPGNEFELIPAVKMETRNPIEVYFGSEFLTICNYCGVMADWSCKTLKLWEIIEFFGENMTPFGKIFKILF